MTSWAVFVCLCWLHRWNGIEGIHLLSSYSFEPQTGAPDLIVDSIGGLNGTREGSSNGTALVRFLNSTSGFCKFGACITFWAFSAASTQNSVGRLVLPGRVDFPTFGGAIAFWMYMETEILHNARLVSKFLPDGTTNTATNSLFQVSLLELPFNRTGSLSNRTTITALGEEYAFFVFRFHMQFTTSVEAGAQPVTGDRGLFEFQTHPFKQQWQHIVISFSQTGLKLFRDGKLLETIDAKFGTYALNDSLPVVVGNSAAFNRAPAARLDELQFFGYPMMNQEISEESVLRVMLGLPVAISSQRESTSQQQTFSSLSAIQPTPDVVSTTATVHSSSGMQNLPSETAAVSTSRVAASMIGTRHMSVIEESESRGDVGTVAIDDESSAASENVVALVGGTVGGILLLVVFGLVVFVVARLLRTKSNLPTEQDALHTDSMKPAPARHAVPTSVCDRIDVPRASHYMNHPHPIDLPPSRGHYDVLMAAEV